MKQKPNTARIWKTEPVSISIILSALILCATVTLASILHFRADEGTTVYVAAPANTTGTEKAFSQLSDPLLVLVNGEIPLPENWEVMPCMVDDEIVDARIYWDYYAMRQAAAQEDVWFWVASGYRSTEEQTEVLNREIQKWTDNGLSWEEGERKALNTVARPGHSEHNTGLAIDLNDVSSNFENTKAYDWLQRNAAEYGFIQRYHKEKSSITGIDEESWHYRYVGRAHAKIMESLDLCLEEYVELLRPAESGDQH